MNMKKKLTIRKGYDLNLKGTVDSAVAVADIHSATIAIVPDDFPGISPKPEVKEGQTVKAGTPLLCDKLCPAIKLVSPAAGTVKAIERGARRHIERIIVETDGSDSEIIDTTDFKLALMQSGLWAMMRQRPYDIVPDPESAPVNIFVSGIDTAPLAVNIEPSAEHIAAGVKALQPFTSGKVYIAVPPTSQLDIPGAEMIEVTGPHPAGNPGVIAANIAPINKGETIWTMDLWTLAAIGSLALTGTVDWRHNVAVTGPEVDRPEVVTALPGTPMTALLDGRIHKNERPQRVISGNVMTGCSVGIDGYLRWPYRQVTVILDGSDADEFMGWASMSPNKPSLSRTFLSRLFRGRRFAPDARINGGRRAMIMSGVYERLFPMDIMPEHLLKAILSRNIEQMEALGIYEVAPEDFSVAEWADPSKLELQKIVREGLDYLRKELS